jgi:hypothetical protein
MAVCAGHQVSSRLEVVNTGCSGERIVIAPKLRRAWDGSLARYETGALEPRACGVNVQTKRLVAGAILYAGERTLPFGEGLWALPLSALWT